MKLRKSKCPGWTSLAAGLIVLATTAWAGPKLTLAWQTDPNSGVAGHKILCGPETRNYTYVVDVGNVTRAGIRLPDGWPKYHLAVIAYNSEGLQSNPSEEVVYFPPGLPNLLAERKANEFTISWNSVPGKGYRVLHKSALTDTNWSPVSKLIVAEAPQSLWSTPINPAVDAAFFRLQIIDAPNAQPELRLERRGAADLRLSWDSIPGRGYRVLYKPELTAPDWTPISVVLTSESGLIDWFTQVNPELRSGFFRLEVIPDPEVLPVTNISFTPSGEIRLAWKSIPTRKYQIFHKADMSQTEWTPVSDALLAGSTEMTWTAPIDPAEPSGFYMVRALPE